MSSTIRCRSTCNFNVEGAATLMEAILDRSVEILSLLEKVDLGKQSLLSAGGCVGEESISMRSIRRLATDWVQG
jgi:hypothetical protein